MTHTPCLYCEQLTRAHVQGLDGSTAICERCQENRASWVPVAALLSLALAGLAAWAVLVSVMW